MVDPNKFKSKQLKIQIMDLTNDDGRFILNKVRGGSNSHRRLKEIALYKKLMTEKKWTILNTIVPESVNEELLFPFRDFLAEPLMFQRDGTLYEGRNRIVALSEIDDGISVPFIVVTGLGPAHQRLWDKWHKWSVANKYRKTQFKKK